MSAPTPSPKPESVTVWPLSLDRHIARARKEMGEAKWNRLAKEWDA